MKDIFYTHIYFSLNTTLYNVLNQSKKIEIYANITQNEQGVRDTYPVYVLS